jgi:hypothetical protein
VHKLTIPLSGKLLVAHLAAYGLGVALDAAGQEAFIGHDPDSLEIDPEVSTTATIERVAECVRRTAVECQDTVEADVDSGRLDKAGRAMVWAAIWARPTATDRALSTLLAREEILDRLEAQGSRAAAGLVAGLGAPAAWMDDPERGASRLDGVPGNSTSDFVRGVLRRTLSAAAAVTACDLSTLQTTDEPANGTDEDKTGWSPPGTQTDRLYQWLAAVGLGLLPVGLSAGSPGRTPGYWGGAEGRQVRLPVLAPPVSMARLRALLQLPELVRPLDPTASARLRSLGIRELVSFPEVRRSNQNMVAFYFGRATRIGL